MNWHRIGVCPIEVNCSVSFCLNSLLGIVTRARHSAFCEKTHKEDGFVMFVHIMVVYLDQRLV